MQAGGQAQAGSTGNLSQDVEDLSWAAWQKAEKSLAEAHAAMDDIVMSRASLENNYLRPVVPNFQHSSPPKTLKVGTSPPPPTLLSAVGMKGYGSSSDGTDVGIGLRSSPSGFVGSPPGMAISLVNQLVVRGRDVSPRSTTPSIETCKRAEEVMEMSRAWRMALGGGAAASAIQKPRAGLPARGEFDGFKWQMAKARPGDGDRRVQDAIDNLRKVREASERERERRRREAERRLREEQGSGDGGPATASNSPNPLFPATPPPALLDLAHDVQEEQAKYSRADLKADLDLRQWLASHNLLCLEKRLVSAGSRSLDQAARLTAWECSQCAGGFHGMEARLVWAVKGLSAERYGAVATEGHGSRGYGTLSGASTPPDKTGRDLEWEAIGRDPLPLSPLHFLPPRHAESPAAASSGELSWRALAKRESAMTQTLALLGSLSSCLQGGVPSTQTPGTAGLELDGERLVSSGDCGQGGTAESHGGGACRELFSR